MPPAQPAPITVGGGRAELRRAWRWLTLRFLPNPTRGPQPFALM